MEEDKYRPPNSMPPPCRDDYMDCIYFDPDICLNGECAILDSLLQEDDYGYNEDDQPF